ncbi:unnamed protein product, partial [Rotaria socialis]
AKPSEIEKSGKYFLNLDVVERLTQQQYRRAIGSIR